MAHAWFVAVVIVVGRHLHRRLGGGNRGGGSEEGGVLSRLLFSSLPAYLHYPQALEQPQVLALAQRGPAPLLFTHRVKSTAFRNHLQPSMPMFKVDTDALSSWQAGRQLE